jgi:hypothetical protein
MDEPVSLNTEKKGGRFNLKPYAIKPGEVRNPHGRPKGSRQVLADSFIRDVYNKWEDQGASALDETIKRKPWEFVKIVAGLMPQKLEITNRFQNMADNELVTILSRATRELTPLIDRRAIEAHSTGADDRASRRRDGDQRGIIEATTESLPALSEADSVSCRGENAPGAASNGGESVGKDLCRRS